LIAVELAPEVTASLRAMKDRGTPPTRCHRGLVQSAVAGGVRRLIDGALSGGVRPWDLPELQRRATGLGEVSSARAVSVDEDVLSEVLGQGETETRHRYQWTEGRRSILAEDIKNEIYDGATPYSTYVRGVIVDGDRGVLLTGSGDSALIIEGWVSWPTSK
jgi:hypothetical protein